MTGRGPVMRKDDAHLTIEGHQPLQRRLAHAWRHAGQMLAHLRKSPLDLFGLNALGLQRLARSADGASFFVRSDHVLVSYSESEGSEFAKLPSALLVAPSR